MTKTSSPQETHFNQARASLQQAISWYTSFRRHWNYPPNPELQAAVRTDLQSLKSALDKLDQKVIRISTFGLVSCGKSSVINALLGQEILETGPLHGVTTWPKSLRWTPPGGKVQLEFIDTPGLDEIEGEQRTQMAQEVAQKSDLILFVVAGDITRTEYKALCELRRSQKPLILVFNKVDLYPQTDRETIYQQLQQQNAANLGEGLDRVISPDEIVMVAAKPQPIQVRVEAVDGSVTTQWETPPPQINELKETILRILNREGRSLLALNALVQSRDAQINIAKKTVEIRQEEAEAIIWQYAKYKALVVAVNPIVLLDVFGGFIADLALIRSLARLYGLPITSYEAGTIWRRIIASSAALLLGEIGSSLILGIGKSGFALTSAFESPSAFAAFATTASLQGAIAGYGAYAIGKIAQVYLQQGCTWGALGASTLIAEILSQVEPKTIIYRLRQELLI
jgi:hypothetical protein